MKHDCVKTLSFILLIYLFVFKISFRFNNEHGNNRTVIVRTVQQIYIYLLTKDE